MQSTKPKWSCINAAVRMGVLDLWLWYRASKKNWNQVEKFLYEVILIRDLNVTWIELFWVDFNQFSDLFGFKRNKIMAANDVLIYHLITSRRIAMDWSWEFFFRFGNPYKSKMKSAKKIIYDNRIIVIEFPSLGLLRTK